MDITHKITEGLYSYGGLYIQKKKPTIVYAPGRVGSMGLIKNLRDSNVFSFKVESFETEKRGATSFVKNNIMRRQRPANIISLVRDPIAIMCSYYFSKCSQGWIPEGQKALEESDISKLQSVFIKEVLESDRLDSHLYWFEKEFEVNTGINVFDYPFDSEKKFGVVESESYSVLILRTELADAIKTSIIKSFLNISDFNVTRENVRSDKKYAAEYELFKNTLTLPESSLKKVYTSPYSTHFFSENERTMLYDKWS